jgi:hypothetical protein
MGTASFLLRFCKLKPAEAFTKPNAAYFHGRCIGVLENLKLMTEMLPQQNPSVCTKITAGTTLGQMRDVVAKYADEHPDQTNNDLGRLAYTRANWIFRLPTLMVWRCAVAGPSWTRSASISTLNPWASML